MKQGCRLARLFDKSIRDFYARNRYFLINTQAQRRVYFLSSVFVFFHDLVYYFLRYSLAVLYNKYAKY